MIQSSLELIQGIQSEYERKAERIRLLKLAKAPRRTSPLVTELVWFAKDLTYLVYRLIARKRNAA
jgi:hypothetical protein